MYSYAMKRDWKEIYKILNMLFLRGEMITDFHLFCVQVYLYFPVFLRWRYVCYFIIRKDHYKNKENYKNKDDKIKTI